MTEIQINRTTNNYDLSYNEITKEIDDIESTTEADKILNNSESTINHFETTKIRNTETLEQVNIENQSTESIEPEITATRSPKSEFETTEETNIGRGTTESELPFTISESVVTESKNKTIDPNYTEVESIPTESLPIIEGESTEDRYPTSESNISEAEETTVEMGLEYTSEV